jgi:hypothetical protein
MLLEGVSKHRRQARLFADKLNQYNSVQHNETLIRMTNGSQNVGEHNQ